MFRHWSARWFTVAALIAGSAQGAPAQDKMGASPFGKIPEKAPIVVKLPGLGTLTTKVGAFLDGVLPAEQAKKLKDQMTMGLGEGLKGRDLAGVDQTKPIYAFVADFKKIDGDSPPNGGVLIPITKYADFKKAFTAEEQKTLKTEDGVDTMTVQEHPVYLIDGGDHAFLSSSLDLAKEHKGKFASLAGKFSKVTEKAFADTGFCILVNMVQINDEFGAQIQAGKQQVEVLLGLAGGQMDKKQMEMAKEVILGIFQIVEDSKAVLIGISMKESGVGLKVHGQFGKDTEIGNFLKDTKAGPLAALGAMPAGKMSYSGMQVSPRMGKAIGKLIQQAAADDPDEGIKEKLAKAAEALVGAGQKESYSTADLNPASGFTVTQFDNADAALAAQMQLFGALADSSTFGNMPLKAKPAIKENAEKAEGLTFNMVKLSFDLDKAVADPKIPEQMKEMMKSMFEKMTGESMTLWLAKDGNAVVQISAKDWAAAQKIAAQYAAYKKGAEGVGATEAFKTARAGLPADATVLSLIESGSLVGTLYDYAKSMAGMIPGADAEKLPPLKIDKAAPKSFFGLSGTLQAEHGGFDVFVPTATVKEIVKMAKPLMKNDD